MADVIITIQSGTISVDSHKVTVSKAAKHKVKWVCDEGTFNIVFKPGSDWPNPTTAENGKKWKAETGPFTTEGSLYYGITASGAKPLDPEIQIIP
jgi:hypothetical protein